MKYYDILKVGAKTSAPTSDVNEDSQKLDELNMSVGEIKYMLNDILAQAAKPSDCKSVKKATLTDQEVSEILTMLEEFEQNYFKNLPLSEKFAANFFWNIPYKVYKAAVRAKQQNLPVYFNPIFWFYAICLDEPEDMIAPFVCDMVNNLNADDEAIKAIEDAANDYVSTYLGDDEEETDNQ